MRRPAPDAPNACGEERRQLRGGAAVQGQAGHSELRGRRDFCSLLLLIDAREVSILLIMV